MSPPALEHRQDPLTGRWATIAALRGERPDEFVASQVPPSSRPCPFCEGHEVDTPHEVLAIRPTASSSDSPGWQARVIANKYPAFAPEAPQPLLSDDFFTAQPAAGLHEVIVESPRHVTSITELSHDELATVLRVYRDRQQAIAAEGRWPYVLIFKNSGAAAGASLAHIHSQLIALPQIPAAIAQKIERSQTYFAQHGRPLWRELLDRELADGRRIVAASDNFVALCPWASTSPYEMLVLPTRSPAAFALLADNDLQHLAKLLRDLIARLETIVPHVAFNWMLHTILPQDHAAAYYSWHWEIVPRLTRPAGYEWSTAQSINPLPPEIAASRLRDCPTQAASRG